MRLKVCSLFSGIGGIDLGFIQAGFDVVWASEKDSAACKTYRFNFGEDKLVEKDIRKVKTDEIPDFDVLAAGFPCQPFSYAGKRMGFGDTRGTLFFEVERLLEAYEPKAFLLEIVRGLYTHDKGRTFSTIMEKLHGLGYETYDLLLNSSDFGVPQNRVRLYILGIKGTEPKMTLTTHLGAVDSHSFKRNNEQMELFPTAHERKTVGDILENQVDPKYYCSE